MKETVLAVLLSATALGGVSGCSWAPKQEEMVAADYGTPISQAEMQAQADKYLLRVLKDPDSRRVEWGRSGKLWVWGGLLGGGTSYGYGLEALVNAKNSFGGYTGSKPYLFLFKNGQLVAGREVPVTDMEPTYGFIP